MTLADALDRLPREKDSPAEKFRQALALFEDGVALQRAKLRRRFPEASDEELHEKLLAWLGREDEA